MIIRRTKEEITALLTAMTGYFSWMRGQKEEGQIPEIAIDFWTDALQHLTQTEISEGLKIIIQSSKWMPTPQEFIQAIRGNDEAECLQDWLIILQALRISAYDRPTLLDKLPPHAKLALQTVGGSALLSEAKIEYLHSTIKTQFVSAWKSFKSSKRWKEEKEIVKLTAATSQHFLPPSTISYLERTEEEDNAAKERAIALVKELSKKLEMKK